MKSNPLDILHQNEWDALIISILKPFFAVCSQDTLITPDDLQQEAWIGLLKASERYDPTKAKFTTFAYLYIRGHIMRYIGRKLEDKPEQIDAEPEDIDTRFYLIDDKSEKEDMMYAIIKRVHKEPHVDILIEHFIRGKSFRKIAKERGVTHAAIALRVNKLLDILEVRLQNENS